MEVIIKEKHMLEISKQETDRYRKRGQIVSIDQTHVVLALDTGMLCRIPRQKTEPTLDIAIKKEEIKLKRVRRTRKQIEEDKANG
jgi:hypothetical protein